MKFGLSNVFVLCAVLLSLETFAAPVQIVDARDESILAARAAPKKAPVVKAAPKPAAVPKKVPAATAKKPAAAVPKAPAAAPKAPAAVPKAPVTVPKAPATVPKAPATVPKAPATVPKAPATVPKAPATVPKAPATVPKAPAAAKKAPAATPPKKAPVPAAPKKVASKSTTATPKPTATTSTCSFKSQSKTTKPKTIKGRVVATTQFHATCKTFAASIKSAVQGGTFALQPERIWPNEFTWSGGFYVTPDENKAQLFGATFLADKCATKGGVVVMKFTLNQSALQVQEVSAADVDEFRGDHGRLGKAIQAVLKKQAPADTAAPDPAVDDSISKDDDPAVQKPEFVLPTPAEVEDFINDPTKLSPLKKRRDAFVKRLKESKTVDVVAGAGPLSQSQKSTIRDATKVGIEALEEPFNQVVLITDKAMKALTFVDQADLPTCLAEKQPALVQRLKDKAAGLIPEEDL